MAIPQATYPDRAEEQDYRDAIIEAERIVRPPLQINDVFRLYEVPESQMLDIVHFLTDWPAVVPVLVNAEPLLRDVFGHKHIQLEVEYDPESGDRDLFCVILSNGDPETALQQLSEFEENWFSGTTAEMRRHINFTVDTYDDDQI
jgi:hypothetical protein